MSDPDDEADRSGGSLPASEEGTGMIPEDRGNAGDIGVPASEGGAVPDGDGGDATGEPDGAAQSWPGKSFGSIPPPG
jgi:hypothetical protein